MHFSISTQPCVRKANCGLSAVGMSAPLWTSEATCNMCLGTYSCICWQGTPAGQGRTAKQAPVLHTRTDPQLVALNIRCVLASQNLLNRVRATLVDQSLSGLTPAQVLQLPDMVVNSMLAFTAEWGGTGPHLHLSFQLLVIDVLSSRQSLCFCCHADRSCHAGHTCEAGVEDRRAPYTMPSIASVPPQAVTPNQASPKGTGAGSSARACM